MAHKQKVRYIMRGDILGMGPDGQIEHNSPWYAWFRVESVTPLGKDLAVLAFSNGWSIMRDLDDENIIADTQDPDIIERFRKEVAA